MDREIFSKRRLATKGSLLHCKALPLVKEKIEIYAMVWSFKLPPLIYNYNVYLSSGSVVASFD
jgi:hypothetical protein